MRTCSTRNAISNSGSKTLFKGSITALATPLADGRINELALRDLIEWQIEEGSLPAGTLRNDGGKPNL